MNNKYLYVVMAAVMASIAYYVGMMPYFAVEGGFSDGWWYAGILAVGLGAGSTGGEDAVSILVEGIKGYIGTMINMAILGAVTNVVITLAVRMAPFDPMAMVNTMATFVVSALMMNLALSYLKKAA